MMLLFEGRPENRDERLAKEARVYDLLDDLGVKYSRADHEPAMTMEACEEIDRTLGATICKNLLLCNRQCTDFYLLLMPGDKIFKTKDLSAQLGVSRLSFASGEMMEQLLDITPGSLSVMGLMNDKDMRVRLIIDKPVLRGEYVGFHPCINSSSLKVKTKDLVEIIIPAMKHSPTVVELPTVEE
jgi:Ala-tRNA(Pro) deacylase